MSILNFTLKEWGERVLIMLPCAANPFNFKISLKHNIEKLTIFLPPLVGYSNLSSAPTTSAIRANQKAENRNRADNRSKRIARTTEISHNQSPFRQRCNEYFITLSPLYWLEILSFRLTTKKLLFDILKNLVTFTASNHCMCGEKRYN